MKKTRVEKVVDGDTFKDSRGRFFRLAGVDAPEKNERGGKKATETLRNMIEDETIYFREEGQSYGRKVVTARVKGEKTTINEKMRRRGYK